MPLFCKHCVCLLILFSFTDSVLYPSSKCYKNDCFYESPDFKNVSCKIYNTSVCLDFYTLEGSFEKTSEEESKFLVSIVPYLAELFVYPMTVTRSAINFTFTIDITDINELVVKISTKVSPMPICRIFDFQNVNNSNTLPINLFYDCLFNLVEHGMQNVVMDFITLPVKEKLSYYVFIPGTKYPGSCIWQPLIMVFCGSLQNGEVRVKFSQVPELYNVSSYVVKLTQSLSGDEKIIDIIPDVSRRMLFARFSSVDEGTYSVSVKPIIRGVHDNCWAETDVFLVKETKSDHMLTIYLCIFIFLIFSALIFLKMFGLNVAKLRLGSRRQILLFYSHDCNEHNEFVTAFIDYLEKHCHVEVSTIYGDECNPHEWIKKKYKDCNIIMYLISAGLFYSLNSEDGENLRLQKGHEWRKQLLWATNFILSELLNKTDDVRRKKICKVCFSYSREEHIPDSLQPGFGKCYFLPQNGNDLMNFMHDSWECFLCSNLCVNNFESPFKSAVLLEKLRGVQTANLFIEPLDDTTRKDFSFVDLPEKSINLDEISTSSDSSDENFDSFINFSSNLFSDNVSFAIKEKDFVKLNKHKPLSDSEESSGNEESDLLHFQTTKLHSENEARCVVENILNNN